ncbi:hypothetical protein BYZ73_15140 [Rhodovulum viride]|uniref:Uncharacterized protein n=1 Tax=Rhodovulum viride TaxID=1231134 RepID=A0ABX9DDJ9_9RHOB|nr:hypothetical protein BYZ73_15140 [Rhodovulum viride]
MLPSVGPQLVQGIQICVHPFFEPLGRLVEVDCPHSIVDFLRKRGDFVFYSLYLGGKLLAQFQCSGYPIHLFGTFSSLANCYVYGAHFGLSKCRHSVTCGGQFDVDPPQVFLGGSSFGNLLLDISVQNIEQLIGLLQLAQQSFLLEF